MKHEKISALRQSYEKAELNRENLHQDPIKVFGIWFDEALADTNIVEANGMVLSTVNEDGQPSSRIVLLKGFDHEGFIFYSNYQSRKGNEMPEGSKVALNFWWYSQERQVRIEGTVTRTSRETSTRYFSSRPIGSQMGAIASPQSTVIKDRSILDNELKRIEREVSEGRELTCPDHWGGYLVSPHRFEFWQGRQNRLHDRFQYRKASDGWRIDRLAP